MSDVALRLWYVYLPVALILLGCRRPVDDFVPSSGGRAPVTQEDLGKYLIRGVDTLKRLPDYQIGTAADRIVFQFQTWADAQAPDPNWIADPLFSRLPRRLQDARGPRALSMLKFRRYDVWTLREASWMRDVAKQVARSGTLDADLQQWIDESTEKLGRENAERLATSAKIFDWVIRNIDLEDVPPGYVEAEHPPPWGTGRLAWEGLLAGTGDAGVRARCFILTARQLRIPVVLLGISTEGEPRPWLAAALIDQELYLFDTRLGLPIPAASGQGIATLSAVIDDPGMLRSLDVGDLRYRLEADDLKKIVALIDATPPYLSQRMRLVEVNLPRDYKLVLTIAASALAKSLRQCTGITNVALWTAPYDAQQVHDAAFRDKRLWAVRSQDIAMLEDPASPLGQGRRKHFRGEFRSEPAAAGAKQLYLESRVPDAEMSKQAEIQVKAHAKQVAANDGVGMSSQQKQALWRIVTNNLIRAKVTASYWLGLISFEEDHLDVAVNYLDKRTYQRHPNGIWKNGATYNLGRTHERMAETSGDPSHRERAIQWYLRNDDAPQRHGNLLRVKRLGGDVNGASGDHADDNSTESEDNPTLCPP